MRGSGYLKSFRKLVTTKTHQITFDTSEGVIVQKIIDILCEHNLMAYEGVAILEKCAEEVIGGSKIKKRTQ